MARVLLTGATGYVGGRLLPRLLQGGHSVRAMSRHPERSTLAPAVSVVRGDPVADEGLNESLQDIEVAFYLIHSMGRGSGAISEFAERDRRAAANFATAASAAGVQRVVYLGGLGGDRPQSSEHLRSRHEVAAILRADGPELVYLRAAMVIGAGSASFEMLRHLVQRLPAMVCPRWIDTRTQPVAVTDVLDTLALAAQRAAMPAEVQLGGADVLSYRAMMTQLAHLLGRRAPLIMRVPLLTPRLSSHWVSLVTGIEAGLARPLIDGLSEEMLVSTAPGPGINERPLGFDDAVREALREQQDPHEHGDSHEHKDPQEHEALRNHAAGSA
jgi:uncharacterized protein YbjT (DUF2867 family)